MTWPLTPVATTAVGTDGDLGELNLDKKKKKKKKVAIADPVCTFEISKRCSKQHAGACYFSRLYPQLLLTASGPVSQEAANGEEEGGEEEAAGVDVTMGKKKKKKKAKARTDEDFGAEEPEPPADGDKENEDDGRPNEKKLPWDGSDRDYTYQELLGAAQN